jgi:hypothetical protein
MDTHGGGRIALTRPHSISADPRRLELLQVFGGALVAAIVVMSASVPAGARVALALTAMWLVAGLGATSPRALLYSLVAWLSVLGLVRHVTSNALGPAHADPYLLVEPLAVAVLVFAAVRQRGLAVSTNLARATFVLALLMVAGALNPAQGSFATGLAGLLFGLIPVCAFWIGRAFCDDRTFGRILGLVAGLGLGEALYGLFQTFAGFPSWDAAWIRSAGYSALSVGDATRAFGGFSSASEYAAFLSVALLAWIVYGARLARVWLSAVAVAVLAVALVYESSRGVMFLIPAALVLMLAARSRRPVSLSLVLAALAVLILPAVVSRVAPASGGNGNSSLIEHQVGGLKHPLSRSSSTLSIHAALVMRGIRAAVSDPLGSGTGAVTIAGSKFGGESRTTEADPSNAAVALGIPGLLAYAAVLVLGFRQAYTLAARRRDACALIALGLLVVTILQWLNGGQYAVALLVWLTLGWVDRSCDPRERQAAVGGGGATA